MGRVDTLDEGQAVRGGRAFAATPGPVAPGGQIRVLKSHIKIAPVHHRPPDRIRTLAK